MVISERAAYSQADKADSIKVALGIGNCALGNYCLMVTQANHGSEFSMPMEKWHVVLRFY